MIGDPRLPAHFWAKVSVDFASGCWNWTAARNSRGYGSWGVNGKARSTHRVTYEVFVGEIPADLTIDHLCRNKSCCNPWHLEVVTIAENVRRAPRKPKTHCLRGHELADDNVYVNARGNRTCKSCAKRKNKYGRPGRPSKADIAAREQRSA